MNTHHRKTLLVIDDDRLFCDTVSQFFAVQDIKVYTANSGEAGRHHCAKTRIDVVLLDQKLPDVQGIDLCTPLLNYNDRSKIIFITAYPSFDHAVSAMRKGAYDYLSKPFELEALNLAVQKAFRTIALEKVEQLQAYKNRIENEETVLIGNSQGLADVFQLIQLSADNDAPVLITGETGTGKNVIAKTIHYMGKSKNNAFISVNCAAIPESLMESELFGHEKGAFTGALATKKGVFEMADGGTLFLDEIGELPMHMQSKLLGVLDDRLVKRIGGETVRPVDVRIIAATNRDIETAINENSFRNDLFYRLSVMQIHTPPLRERLSDIAELSRYFMQKAAPTCELVLAEEEIDKLKAYHWPGNVRELKNIIERSIFLRKNEWVQPSQLVRVNTAAPKPDETGNASKPMLTLEQMEALHIKTALHRYENNHTRTASALGISRSTLIRKLSKYQIK